MAAKFRRRAAWFLSLDWRDKALVAEGVAMLIAARIAVVTIAPRKLLPPPGAPEGASGPGSAPPAAVHLGTLLEKIAPAMPFRAMCLETALAAKWMLRRRGIDTTMYLGMARERGEYLAHAWLRCGGATITGGGTIPFTPLASFRDSRSGGGDPLLE